MRNVDKGQNIREGMTMHQLQIFLAEPENEAAEVANILALVAERFHLRENTNASRVPNTICSYCQSTYSGPGVGARLVQDMILIDLNPRDAEQDFFNEVCFFASQEFFRTFPGRVRIPQPHHWVAIRHY